MGDALVCTGDALAQNSSSHAEQEDDGLALIALITIAALTLSLGSIFALLNHDQRVTAGHYALALASVPLGWLMLHTVWSFHYAHVFYSPRPR